MVDAHHTEQLVPHTPLGDSRSRRYRPCSYRPHERASTRVSPAQHAWFIQIRSENKRGTIWRRVGTHHVGSQRLDVLESLPDVVLSKERLGSDEIILIPQGVFYLSLFLLRTIIHIISSFLLVHLCPTPNPERENETYLQPTLLPLDQSQPSKLTPPLLVKRFHLRIRLLDRSLIL